jgi:hypothetical protein
MNPLIELRHFPQRDDSLTSKSACAQYRGERERQMPILVIELPQWQPRVGKDARVMDEVAGVSNR